MLKSYWTFADCFGLVQNALDTSSKKFWTWIKKQNSVLKIHFWSSPKLLESVQNQFGPLERQDIKRYAEGLGMIPNLVSSKQNIIMISSSLLDILRELMPKLSRKSCVVHSMAIKKLQCVCNNEINSFGEN